MPRYLVTVRIVWKPPKTGFDPYGGRPQDYSYYATAPTPEAAKKIGLRYHDTMFGHHKARVKSMKVLVTLAPKSGSRRSYNVKMRVKLWNRKAPTIQTQRHTGTTPKAAADAALENLYEEYGPSEIEGVKVLKVTQVGGVKKGGKPHRSSKRGRR